MKIVIAFLLTLPIAWERERHTRSMGLRTFPLVAVASCGYVLTALGFLETDENAKARIIQGLMVGIGFIGGGAILKEGVNVRGTATAASVWAIGALGAAVGYGQYEVAVLMSIVNYFTLRVLTPIGQRIDRIDRSTQDQSER
ncbi:MgtC/SapB family protein [Pantanalinema rosaneae CENA516]|uniref:MgtC/SapB family protein n=1 Tax=Pantanalinema rosaneae TaxID=1620701 RepID=UPI003D6F309F